MPGRWETASPAEARAAIERRCRWRADRHRDHRRLRRLRLRRIHIQEHGRHDAERHRDRRRRRGARQRRWALGLPHATQEGRRQHAHGRGHRAQTKKRRVSVSLVRQRTARETRRHPAAEPRHGSAEKPSSGPKPRRSPTTNSPRTHNATPASASCIAARSSRSKRPAGSDSCSSRSPTSDTASGMTTPGSTVAPVRPLSEDASPSPLPGAGNAKAARWPPGGFLRQQPPGWSSRPGALVLLQERVDRCPGEVGLRRYLGDRDACGDRRGNAGLREIGGLGPQPLELPTLRPDLAETRHDLVMLCT